MVGQTFQNLENVSPRTYIGSGKTFEVEGAVDELEADTVIFDDELTPGTGHGGAHQVLHNSICIPRGRLRHLPRAHTSWSIVTGSYCPAICPCMTYMQLSMHDLHAIVHV